MSSASTASANAGARSGRGSGRSARSSGSASTNAVTRKRRHAARRAGQRRARAAPRRTAADRARRARDTARAGRAAPARRAPPRTPARIPSPRPARACRLPMRGSRRCCTRFSRRVAHPVRQRGRRRSGGTRSDHVAVDDELLVYGADDLSIVQSPGIGSITSTFCATAFPLRSTISYSLSYDGGRDRLEVGLLLVRRHVERVAEVQAHRLVLRRVVDAVGADELLLAAVVALVHAHGALGQRDAERAAARCGTSRTCRP